MNIRVVLLSLLFLSLFFIHGPGHEASRSVKSAWDLGHLIIFALWSYLVLRRVEVIEKWPFSRQAAAILLFTLFTGAGIEVIQNYTSRTPSIEDIARDLVGALIAIVFLAPKRGSIQPGLIRLFRIAVITLTGIALYPLGCAVADEYMARRDFPALSSLNSDLELSRWSCKTDCTIVHGGGRSLKVPLTTTQYSGATLEYFPRDWRGYRSLRFRIYNELPEPLAITCRVHDGRHTKGIQHYYDRYNKRFILNPGWNDLQVPLADVVSAPKSRQMDMSDIRNVGFFVTRLKKEMNIYIDDVMLERYMLERMDTKVW